MACPKKKKNLSKHELTEIAQESMMYKRLALFLLCCANIMLALMYINTSVSAVAVVVVYITSELSVW